MTVANILIYVALIGYILYRRVQGQPVKEGRRLFILPILLVVLGYGDVTHGAGMKPLEITLTVIAGVISLGLGLLRGRVDKLSDRNGFPFVQWGAASLMLFVGNIAAKLVLDLIGIAAGSAGSAVGKSLLLTFGLTLLGEAVVLKLRTSGTTGLLRPSRTTTSQPRQPRTGHFAGVTPPPATSSRYMTDSHATAPARSPEPASVWRPANSRDGFDQPARPIDQPTGNATTATTAAGSVADALQRHHARHKERHQDHHHHDHGHRH